MDAAPNPNGTYTFASQPRAVQPQRPKYRNPQCVSAAVQAAKSQLTVL